MTTGPAHVLGTETYQCATCKRHVLPHEHHMAAPDRPHCVRFLIYPVVLASGDYAVAVVVVDQGRGP